MHQLSFFTTTVVEIVVLLANHIFTTQFGETLLLFVQRFFLFPKQHPVFAALWTFSGGGHYRCTMQLGWKQWSFFTATPLKIKGWNLKIHPAEKGNSSSKPPWLGVPAVNSQGWVAFQEGHPRWNHGNQFQGSHKILGSNGYPPRKLTWLAWTSPFFGRIYIYIWYIFKWVVFPLPCELSGGVMCQLLRGNERTDSVAFCLLGDAENWFQRCFLIFHPGSDCDDLQLDDIWGLYIDCIELYLFMCFQ